GGAPVPPDPTVGGTTVYLPVVNNGPPADTPTPTPTAGPAPAQTVAAVTTPLPTPTRKPIRITKLGLGVYDSGGGMLPALDESRPSVILLMDPSIDFAHAVRQKFPKAFIVGRIFAPSQPLDNPSARGAAFADTVAASAVPLKDVVNAWMSYNEIGSPSDPQSMVNYNAFQVAFAHRMQDHYGIPAVCNNDGPRAIPAELYPRYYGQAIATCKYFGFHIYPDKQFTSLRDPAAASQVFYYRQIYQALVSAGIQPGPFIATEVGLWDGWKNVTSDTSMGQDYTWLADQMNQDPYVLGMTVYGLFAPGRSEWDRFNIDHTAILNMMGDYNTVQ
ncbi:MAG TPA: hypothetical protein VFZ25_02315, partial [Chloroflexota bacterium]|nr:hypothetical protein [Chloroflexota bacterium]